MSDSPENPDPPAPSASPVGRIRGKVVFLYAYDVAYEIGRSLPPTLLGQTVAQYSVDLSRRNPRHLIFFKPGMIRLPPQERIGPHGAVRLDVTIKILPIGAITIQVSVPFDIHCLDDLVVYHDLQFTSGSLNDEVHRIAEQIRKELAGVAIRTNEGLLTEEAYTVFCLESPVGAPSNLAIRAEAWLESHRRTVAALLTQEPDIHRLSRQEAIESTSRSLSYYEDDLVVIDWDAALIIDSPHEWEETIYVLELANLQLAELEAYDRLLDSTLERSYRDLGVGPSYGRKRLLRELRELRIDLARFSDELSNITKFFGDWHLARIYETASARFHLADWHRTVDEKLKTVAELHEILKSDQSSRWMMLLEFTIVLLFIIDLAILFTGAKR